jgi:DNA modification methylase
MPHGLDIIANNQRALITASATFGHSAWQADTLNSHFLGTSVLPSGYLLQQAGFHLLNDIAWYKPNASPNLSCRYFTASHETLLWARKDKQAKHTFNYPLMRNWEENYRLTCTNKCQRCGKKCGNTLEVLHRKGSQMRSVWAVITPKRAEKKFGKHPTQKPLELLKMLSSQARKRGASFSIPSPGFVKLLTLLPDA